MTKDRLDDLIGYYSASHAVLERSFKATPEKFNKEATEAAISIFTDTINLLKYFETNVEVLPDIVQTDVSE